MMLWLITIAFLMVDLLGCPGASINRMAVFSYDALGRLVGRQAPWPGVTDEWRYETYLYDGDRRIAEHWDDPLFNSNNGGNNANQPPQVSGRVVRTEREYVYTPGYIDEFIAEYDSTGDYWPILQDANSNAVAMTDDTGVVVRQLVFSPYRMPRRSISIPHFERWQFPRP